MTAQHVLGAFTAGLVLSLVRSLISSAIGSR